MSEQTSPVRIPEGYYYTVPEVAEIHQLGRRSIIYWLEQGWIKGVKTGIGWLIEADSVNGFVPPRRGPKAQNLISNNELINLRERNKLKLLTFIYALVDPLTDDIRYVGKTQNPYARYYLHLSEGKKTNLGHTNSPKNLWIKNLLEKQLQPNISIIEETSPEQANTRELYWVNKLSQDGFYLLNARI